MRSQPRNEVPVKAGYCRDRFGAGGGGPSGAHASKRLRSLLFEPETTRQPTQCSGMKVVLTNMQICRCCPTKMQKQTTRVHIAAHHLVVKRLVQDAVTLFQHHSCALGVTNDAMHLVEVETCISDLKAVHSKLPVKHHDLHSNLHCGSVCWSL